MNHFVLLVILFCFSSAYSQTTISGDVGGMTFNPSGNPWIVTENIIIAKEKSVLIKAGCVFLFKQFTGIEVHGKLVVEGSKESQVIFTSFNDSKYNQSADVLPNPFDWNGIVIHSNAKEARFSFTTITFSVFGIKSNSNDVFIDNSTFLKNGQFNFTLFGDIQSVLEDSPFSYSGKKQGRQIQPLKVATIATGSVGVICGIVSGIFWSDYGRAWHDAEYIKNSSEIANANNQEKIKLKNACILTSVSLTNLSAAVALYLFNQREKNHSQVTISPIFVQEITGILFSYTF
jgi:hypothetical protein